ncbi:MAG: hypothetical protein LRZ85_10435 [Alphaproteobacteria bacterium]|nr:hypothetical protein [Alphaproteobacteria bacterium]MCD8571389.1 hypothetical protein [Alphaproteobacteria bacterium]
MALGVSFHKATDVTSRNIMDMGPSLFTSPLLSFQPSKIGNNFYEALMEGKPQVSIPIVHKNTVDISKSANLQQNDLTNTSSVRSQINQTKAAFKDTMETAKAEAGEAIMNAAKANGINPWHMAKQLFPGQPCEATNFVLACDPTCIGTIWTTVSNVSSQCSNEQISLVLDQALAALHDASQSKDGNAPQSNFDWQKFDTGDLQRFLIADPMKHDNTGRQIAAAEQAVIEMERNQDNLDAHYTSSGDVYDKVMSELDQSLAAEMVDIKKCAAECEMAADTVPAFRGLTPKEEEIPAFEGVEELKKKLAEAAPKPEPKPEPAMLERLMDPLAKLNPFRIAA